MKYVKKPVIIDAVKYDGTNVEEIVRFTNKTVKYDGETMEIETLEGTMKASVGDYIIKGVNGEFYPCKPDIFKKTYDICSEL